MSSLDELEQRLLAAVTDDTLALDLPELHPPELPTSLWPVAGLLLHSPHVVREGERLIVRGRIGLDLLGAATLTVTFLPGEGALGIDADVDIRPELASLTVERLAQLLALSLPSWPPLAVLEEPLQHIALVLRRDGVKLATSAEIGSLGELKIVAAQLAGHWELVVALRANPGLAFSQLQAALRPLDALRSLVTWDDPALVAATTTTARFPYPTQAGQWSSLAVARGAAFRGVLSLRSPALALLRGLLRLEELPLDMPLAAELSGVRLSACLGRRIVLIPNCLTVESLRVEIAPEPFAVAAKGDVSIELFGSKLPPFTTAVSFSEVGLSLSFFATQPWTKPLGLPIVINEAAFEVRSPDMVYGIAGKITIQNRILAIAACFLGEAPTAFEGQLKGELSLFGAIADLIGKNQFKTLLPNLEPTLRDLTLRLVVDPRGAKVGNHVLPAGLYLAGDVSLLGLSLHADVLVSSKQVKVEGSLAKPIQLGAILSISGATPNTGPALRLDTQGKPVGALAAQVNFLGLRQAVEATLSADGFTFRMAQKLGPLAVSLVAALQNAEAFSANGAATFGLDSSIGPIHIGNKINLGKINLKTNINAQISVKVGLKTSPSISISASFDFMGIGFHLPRFSVNISTLAEIPKEILDKLRSGATKIFAAILNDPDKWLLAVGKRFINEVEDVGRVLVKHFGKTTEFAAHAMGVTLRLPYDVTAKSLHELGETPEHIAKLMSAAAYPAKEIANALIHIGKSPEVVASILKKTLGLGKEELKDVLHAAGVSADKIGHIIGGIFGHLWPF